MSSLEVAQKYFDGWNRRDPAAIVATFAEGGTYHDPASEIDLSGQAFVEYTSGLFSAFPDLSFDIVSVVPAGDSLVAAQWLMRLENN